ncbi:MAG TPA: molybdopterin cofactor-binding domain-containing protein [Candidatus Dormibacteraeota bacterium]|nr:molybdopterin cofactor-binding domain-containing protein [Candidatus Dormibacteraeota bacterium]
MAPKTGLTRREFVKDAGGILIGFSMVDSAIAPRLLAGVSPDSFSTPSPSRLDAWLRIDKNGMVHVFTGKSEIGMGVETAFGQIVAEELDVPVNRVTLVMGDTAMTADQGGVGGSTSIMMGAKPLRNAAANARYLLTQMASQRLGVPPEQLEVRQGVVHVKSASSKGKSVSYADLANPGDLNDALKVSGSGFSLNVKGEGKPKDPSEYKIVGKPIPRVDLAPKILGHYKYVTDVRVPGMVHGRVVRPSGVGATFVSLDENSVKSIPGFLRTVVKGNFVGVVAENEWAAIQAARALKVTWTEPKQAFPVQQDLYKHMREATPKASKETAKKGDVAAALSGAAKKVEASYEFPFQSHATMGPGCAVADVHADGVTTVWSGGQKPHALQKGYAELLKVPLDTVRVIWVEDAGSYGRPGFEDTGADAVLLSQAVGKPVRVQWMREDMTAWGTKGPAVMCDLAAAIDAQGEATGVQFTSRAFSGGDIMFRPSTAGNYLGAQLAGIPNTSGVDEFAEWGSESPEYQFQNLHAAAHVVPAFYEAGSPMRTTHLRDPEGPATTFAVESFMDEIAAAAGDDPLAFRLKHLQEPRIRAVLTEAAKKAGWDARPSPRKTSASGKIATGRGIALSTRHGTYVGTVAEVEVNRETGEVHVTRFVCAHDCGLIINPEALRGTIEANLVQSMSRGLKEEVMFDRSNVTSVDWVTYPIARASDIPAKVEVVLIDHPNLPSSGAGEPSSRATAAAIANAVFDATGARVRQAPLTPARVKAALDALRQA